MRTDDGKVLRGSKSLSYGALADAASKMPVPEKVTLKDPAQFRYLGKPQQRLDSPMKVDGSAKFGIDVRLPGMLFAVIARPPVIGAKFSKLDDAVARAVPGVVDVKEVPSGVAVYATNTWAAKRGREALVIEWDEGPNKNFSTTRSAASTGGSCNPAGRRGAGSAATCVPRCVVAGARRFDVEYELPYLSHSPMEPLNCLADVRADGCDLWSRHADAVARIAMPWRRRWALDPRKVKVHSHFSAVDSAGARSVIPKLRSKRRWSRRAVGKPVLVLWHARTTCAACRTVRS